MKRISLFRLLLLAVLFVGSVATMSAQKSAKREFRGAWIQCVNGQFLGMGTRQMQQTLSYQLDELQKDGVNAIIFQVRPECDALYKSDLEPWSRFLTGQQGKAPSPYWDPLEWMVNECHKRGMELHAWINPYRAKTKTTMALAQNHIAVQHPERAFNYDGQLILNPGQPENRKYICKVVQDIVRRYDIDGLHIDDYFYPYPVAGLPIPDDAEYAKYKNSINNRGDWRRYNVNLFIEQLYTAIKEVKPWVKFGVSPFGIYRNQRSDPKNGSATNGLQNYDDLYADVLLWVNKGWIDYCVPQIYWEIGNKAADYKTLITWWNRYAKNRPLFIGEDVERTVKYPDPQNPNSHQLPAKHRLHQQMNHVNGTVLWYAKAVVDNVGNYGSVLRTSYWKTPALPPLMPFLDDKSPKAAKKVKARWSAEGYHLTWKKPSGRKWGDQVNRYVVYRFEKGERIDLNNAEKIVAVTYDTRYKLPYNGGHKGYTYVVTALDRVGNESKGVKRKVKL